MPSCLVCGGGYIDTSDIMNFLDQLGSLFASRQAAAIDQQVSAWANPAAKLGEIGSIGLNIGKGDIGIAETQVALGGMAIEVNRIK